MKLLLKSRIKKSFYGFTAIITMLALLISFFPNHVSAASVLVSENFENYSEGEISNLPTSGTSVWKTAGNVPTVDIVKDTVAHNTYASLSYGSSSKTSYFGQNFSSAQTSGLMMEFDLSIPENGAGNIIMYDSGSSISGSNLALKIACSGGTLTYYSGSSAKTAFNYKTDNWYHIKALVNISSQNYILEITDLSDSSNTVFTTPSPASFYTSKATKIGSIAFQFDKSKVGKMNIDNVNVAGVNTTLSSLGLNGSGLTPDFSSAITSYTATAASSVSSVDLTPVASGTEDTAITVNGKNVKSGDMYSLPITAGDNNINVSVTSNTYQFLSTSYNIVLSKIEEYPDPLNVSAVPLDCGALITWDEPQDQTYKKTNIYKVNSDNTNTLEQTVANGVYEAKFKDLKPGQTYSYIVKGQFEDLTESKGVLVSVTPISISAHQMEALDRGLVAMKKDSGVFLSWRLFGNDPSDIGFNIYREGIKINGTPVSDSTNYYDDTGLATSTYSVAPVIRGTEGERSFTVGVIDKDYLSLPLNVPQGGVTPDGKAYKYSANDCSVGDLDGDGQYEIIVKWYPDNAHDNSESGLTGNVYLDAYKLNGKFMWRIDLGRNIRAGAHYTQFMVYDLDGDGKAEIACKTANATVDGTGVVIGDAKADYRITDSSSGAFGKVLSGPEYLTVFNGETGAAMSTVDYDPPRGTISSWGKDDNGNRVDRFLAAVAYLDGQRPSLVMCRGYYAKSVLVAYNWRDGKLTKLWKFDSDSSGNSAYADQGNHNLTVADVDFDGKDEIIYGACVINDDGTGLFSTGKKHGDAMHVSNLDPTTSDIEVFKVNEETQSAMLYNARTGKVLFDIPATDDCGRGLSADIDPTKPGEEVWASQGVGMHDIKGNLISSTVPHIGDKNMYNFAIWWDGDLMREIMDGYDNTSVSTPPFIAKYDYTTGTSNILLTADGTYSNNGTKATPNLQADILGDWREELVLRSQDSTELRIYTTTDITNYKIYTLMHDLQYRESIAWQNVAYNQPPHTSFYLGTDMEGTPVPKMYAVKASVSAPEGLKVISTAMDTITLGWNAVSNAAYYKVYRLNSQTGAYDYIGITQSPNYTDSGLNPDTKYCYCISSLSGLAESDPTSPTEALTQSKPDVPDTTAPSAFEVKAVTIEKNSIELSWTESKDDSGTVSYDVYRDGEYFTTTQDLLISIDNLSAGTTYSFIVKAKDQSGNVTVSNSLRVRTKKKNSNSSGAGSNSSEDNTQTNTNTGSGTAGTGSNDQKQDTPKDKTIVDISATDITLKNGCANVTVNESSIKDAVEAAESKEGSGIIINIPEKSDASGYRVSLPDILNGSKLEYTIKTNLASVIIPADSENTVLNIKGINGDTAALKDDISITKTGPIIEMSMENKKGVISDYNVKVSIPYIPDPNESLNTEHVVVKFVDRDNKVYSVPDGKYDKSTGTVVFTAFKPGKYAVVYNEKTFRDITNHDWAKQAIEVMASKGVINGTSETTFDPDTYISRGDFTLMLVKALGLSAKASDNFSDVSEDAYFYDALGTAKTLGIIKGQSDNKFSPLERISRQDMMVITERALKIVGKLSSKSTAEASNYTDSDEISDYAKNAVETLIGQGLISGDDSKISPLDNTTRAEAIVLLYRIYCR